MTKLFYFLLFNCLISTVFGAEHIMKTPAQLEWKDGPNSLPAGAKMTLLEGDPAKKGPFTMRVQFPANYRIMPHWHPAIEHVTVLEGQFYMGMGEKFDESKAQALPVGGYAVMPIKSKHFAFTSDQPVLLQLHSIGPWGITYLNPADDPRLKK